jgi:hypothetical protein
MDKKYWFKYKIFLNKSHPFASLKWHCHMKNSIISENSQLMAPFDQTSTGVDFSPKNRKNSACQSKKSDFLK